MRQRLGRILELGGVLCLYVLVQGARMVLPHRDRHALSAMFKRVVKAARNA